MTRRLGKLAALFALVVLAASFIGADRTEAHSGHLQKTLIPNMYAEDFMLGPDDGYVDWYVGVQFKCNYSSAYCSDWNLAFNAAYGSWNGTTSMAYIHKVSVGAANETARFIILAPGTSCGSAWGKSVCISGAENGATKYIDANGNTCSPGSWCVARKVITVIKGDLWGTSEGCATIGGYCWFDKQGLNAHELGHYFALGHEPQWNSGFDGNCGDATHFVTVMDYDCESYHMANGPTNWDTCGVNHAYYNWRYGYAGC